MKNLCIIILLIILPVSLFPDRDKISYRENEYNRNKYIQNSPISIPIGYEINSRGFASVHIENMSGQLSYSANLGQKTNGNYSFNLPLQEDQQSGFYKVKVIINGKINNEKFIYLPSANSILI